MDGFMGALWSSDNKRTITSRIQKSAVVLTPSPHPLPLGPASKLYNVAQIIHQNGVGIQDKLTRKQYRILLGFVLTFE